MIRSAVFSVVVFMSLSAARPSDALPTMIRSGYSSCAVCHISPQGGGILTLYGKSIDDAQSFRAGEYQPSENWLAELMNVGGRVQQDLRLVSNYATTPRGLWARPMFRQATALGERTRVLFTAGAKTDRVRRPVRPYEGATTLNNVFVRQALIAYKLRDTFEIHVGRDYLPTGINLPDRAIFVRSRNRFGDDDTPTQAKVYWWNDRYNISAYGFGDGRLENGDQEKGGGVMAEIDLRGEQTTVVGVQALSGRGNATVRRLLGVYARLGFGAWGVFAEHDVTRRTERAPAEVAVDQHASYAQLFWAVREWLVTSVGVERLTVAAPFRERIYAGKFGLSARATPHATISVVARIERRAITGRASASAIIRLALKTVS